MRPGERALVRVSSEGAYGAAGSFSFPSVAPGTDLLYDLQLLSVERVGGERAVRLRADMVWEERMAAAARYREAGNEAFRAGDSRGAATAYEAGLSFVDDGMMAQLMGHYLDDSSALKGSLHLNLAACSLRAGEAEEALAHSRAALALLPGNAKALYRQGRAHAALGQDDSARAALLKAQKADPEDAAVRTALRELDEEERRKAAASSRLFTGLFGAPAPPAKESGEAAGAGETVQPEPPKQAERQAPPAKAGWGLSRATAWFAS
jgi:tetratricopeptide (TPR) repeat protein